MYSSGTLQTDKQGLGDQLEPIYNSSVLIYDTAQKTCWERWTIETSVERGLGKSVIAAQHDDDDTKTNVSILDIYMQSSSEDFFFHLSLPLSLSLYIYIYIYISVERGLGKSVIAAQHDDDDDT